MTNIFCLIMLFCSWKVFAVLLLILKSSTQMDYERTYLLQPTQDTFIHGDRTTYFRNDHLEVGRRGDGLESRILLKFNLDEFVQKSRWGAENTFANVIRSKIKGVMLNLSCVSIGVYSSEQAGRIFVGTVQVSQILQPWEQIAVTSSVRNVNGEFWWADSLDHTGHDASNPFFRSDVSINYNSCQNGAMVSLAISTAVFESWLDDPSSNHGLLIWTDLDPGVESTLKLASTESAYIDRHPQLVVSLQDIINDPGTVCPNQQFLCLDGSCINKSKICNFVEDCLHGNDENGCGIKCDFTTSCPWEIHVHVAPFSTQAPGGKNDTDSNVTITNTDNETMFISPLYAESGPQCKLHITYSSYSSDVETLRVILLFGNQNVTILEKTRSQQNNWLGDVLHLGQLRTPFRVVFEAKLRVGGKMSGPVIDSLELKNCSPDLSGESCPANYFCCDNLVCVHPDDLCNFHKDCLFGEDESSDECEMIPYGGACSFEDGWCGWENVLHDDFNWTRHHGSTASANTGPSIDHTLGTKEGFYVYTEASSISRGHEAYLRSIWFPPPPPETYDRTSPHYHTCKIRFFYHMYGDHIGTLKLYAYQNTTPETSSQLFTEYSEDIDLWQSAVADLPAITESYYLQFESIRGRKYKGDMALDDIMLSRQCFQLDDLTQATTTPTMEVGNTETKRSKSTKPVSPLPTWIPTEGMTFHFSTCGGTGSDGPRQGQCNVAYRHENISVIVLDGKQSWTVPVTKTYSLRAMGAGGGTGVENTIPSRGAQVEASFHLSAGVHLLILVGHKGEDACHDRDGTDFGASGICKAEMTNVDRDRFSVEGKLAGGGGGGGGGTFIAKWNETTGEYIPLIVAGGGGGLSFSPGPSSEGVHGSVESPGSGFSGAQASTYDVSGAGGGWNGTRRANGSQVSGMSFLHGGKGGVECPLAHTTADWRTHGGFGGGGGGCTSGGGGGGYTGGNAPLVKDLYGNGQGGTSFIHPSGFDVKKKSGANSGDGEVVIRAVICPAEMMIGENGRCIGIAKHLPLAAIVGGIVPLILLLCILVTIAVVYRRKQTYHKASAERRDTADYQLNLLRHNASTDFNPCYQLGDSAFTVKDLNEVPRENLKLIRALGQGAFGEVYHGLFQPADNTEAFEVAVKTLPARCTEQDESDFLMEALIMGNFEHPNIVSLKGVCFTQSPRFILLEFMAGGEFKQFLRDSRPRRGYLSPLDMSDLLLAAYDVTKGCEYLESHRFIHRDIAARNILLSSKEKGRTAKIGDFGMARDIYRADYYRKGGQAMLPVKWMPPEAFLDGIFTSKTDVWSFGVLLWEIMSLGYMPYPGLSNQEVIHFTTQGQRMNAPRNCPEPIKELMYLCWKQDPDERPSFSDIMEFIADCLQNADIMNAPLPQDLLDDKTPSVMRPRNSKTSPVLKVHRSSAVSAHTTSGAHATPGTGAFSPAEPDDGEAYLTPDWVLGGRMREHLLLDDGNINNSAGYLGAHGVAPSHEPDHESVKKLKNKQKDWWIGNPYSDSDTSFDPPINQDKNANEDTNLLEKGGGGIAETSFIKPSTSKHLPTLDFSRLPKYPLQGLCPDKVQDLKADDTSCSSFKKSAMHQNSRTPPSRKPNKPVHPSSAHDFVPNETLAADRDNSCCNIGTVEHTPDPDSQPNSPCGGEEASPSSFSPRVLNRFRLPTFSRHSSFENQPPNLSPAPNASLPMLNRMQSLPVSPNPYTMTALSSQPDLTRSTPDTSRVVIGNSRSSSNMASRGAMRSAQSHAVHEDDAVNDAVV